MKFNLNDESLVGGGSKVFNNGIAGKIENVSVDVEKRSAEEPETYPNYKLVVTDESGLVLNQGFYYHKDNDMNSEEKNEANKGYLIGRILTIAKSVVADDFVFPDVDGKDVNEIVDILFTIIKENCSGKRVNVFTTYGTKTKPSQYLGLRYFNFIEAVGARYSRLKETGNDMMERLVEDAPMADSANGKSGAGW